MKKILFILTICLAIVGANQAKAETRWGVVAAGNLSTLKFNQSLIGVDRIGAFSVGLMGELMIPGAGFGVDISVLYSQLGGKIHLGEKEVWASQGYGTERSTLHYIEIPLNLKFKYTNLNGIENIIAPIAFAGPSFTILAGHNNIDALKYAGGEFSVHAGIGCEIIRKIQLNASYNWGLTYSLETKQLDRFSAKNRFWRLSVAYMF